MEGSLVEAIRRCAGSDSRLIRRIGRIAQSLMYRPLEETAVSPAAGSAYTEILIDDSARKYFLNQPKGHFGGYALFSCHIRDNLPALDETIRAELDKLKKDDLHHFRFRNNGFYADGQCTKDEVGYTLRVTTVVNEQR